jgi:hypothetical protein
MLSHVSLRYAADSTRGTPRRQDSKGTARRGYSDAYLIREVLLRLSDSDDPQRAWKAGGRLPGHMTTHCATPLRPSPAASATR